MLIMYVDRSTMRVMYLIIDVLPTAISTIGSCAISKHQLATIVYSACVAMPQYGAPICVASNTRSTSRKVRITDMQASCARAHRYDDNVLNHCVYDEKFIVLRVRGFANATWVVVTQTKHVGIAVVYLGAPD